MRNRKRLAAGAVAATTSIGLAVSGATLLAPAEAVVRQAPVLVETDYGYETTAYGTRVTSEVTGLDSSRSAFSYLACTRLAGRTDSEELVEVSLPADDPYIEISGVESKNRTFRDKGDNVHGGVTGTNRIAKVKLGSADTPRLIIDTLRTRSTAWATLGGKLKTSNEVSSGGIAIEGITEEPGTGTPLDDLLEAVGGGIDEVIAALRENGGAIEIPGLGMVSFGFDRQVTKKRFAAASSFVLRVLVYGPNQVEGGGDDSLVGVGRSWARINRDLPGGLMGGFGYGANTQLLDGVVKVGRLGEQPLPCNGTEGEILKAPTAGIDFPSADGQLVASGLRGRSWGKLLESGGAKAWTEGSVANLTLGPLELRGIVGRANVKQNKAGKIVARNIKGSTIGGIFVDGEPQGSFDPSTAKDIPPIEIPGVAEIRFFVKDKGRRAMRVSAVVIEMLPDTPGAGEVRLGNAQVFIKRY